MRTGNVGRILMSIGAAGTAVGPWLADANRRHTFGPGYGPLARWHGVAEILSTPVRAA